MLADRKGRKLRAAVCSLACPERLGGILELMEAEVPVAEYWLPGDLESLAEAARRFNGDWAGWRRHVWGEEGGPAPHAPLWSAVRDDGRLSPAERRLEASAMLIALAMSVCLGSFLYIGLSREGLLRSDDDQDCALTRFFGWTLELLADRAAGRWRGQRVLISRVLRLVGWRLLHGRGPADLALVCGRLLLAEADHLPGGRGGVGGVVRGLALAAMAAALMAGTRSRLRFFRPSGRLESNLIPRHPIKCLNGVESEPLSGLPEISTPVMLAQRLARMADPDNGLVFLYGDASCGALFCGDTRMMFLGPDEAVRLDRPTVIAAPRRGASSADRAYASIVSGDAGRDVWVRGFLPSSWKVAHGFEAQRNKVCLNNCRTLTVQEILLEFAGGRWNRESGDECVYA
jgi:hypothetical protein